MRGAIVIAGTIVVGAGPDLRHDAAMRIDEGMIAQIGALEAVAYGNDHLPRYGGRAFVALPLFLDPASPTYGRIAPGCRADIALIEPMGSLDAATLFVGGRLVVERGRAAVEADDPARAAVAAWLAAPPAAATELLAAVAPENAGRLPLAEERRG